MAGPTQGGDGFGLGRGGGWYRRRLERDFGMRSVPFPGRRPTRRGRAATTNDRTPTEGSLAEVEAALPSPVPLQSPFGQTEASLAEVEATVPPSVPLRSPLAPTGRIAATVALAICLGLAGCAGGGSERPTATTAAEPLGSRPLVPRTQSQFKGDLDALRGRVVVVNFWASWCLPCREEMPALERVSQDYTDAGKPVTVIGVDASDVRSAAARFLDEVGVSYPTVYDQQGLRGGVAASWSVTGLPQTWFVARDGSRAGRIGGRLTIDDLRSRVDELLAEP
jgi:cytochrome c biogenesis protein CcmG, thiol:disulfide interchange protein DsbE